MTLKQYLLLMVLGTAICWLGWGFTLFLVNPLAASALEMSFFYISLFLALIGSGSVLGIIVRRYFIRNDELVFRHVKNAFRQSVLIGVGLVGIFILLGQSLLTWWNAPLYILFLIFLEATFFTKRKFRNSPYV
ncbi:MAG: hypothetical protein Q7K39_02835 [Candidatus Magasanikbacteria bacterium]|nr:hypothetical protein [Candidatus Magasanikbacteria bacterium]